MIGGVVEVAEDGRHLSLYRGFLKVSDGENEIGRVPLDDITALLLSAHQVSLSKNLITALLERKAIIVTTGRNWHPLGVTLPLDAHFEQAGILRDQIALSLPRQKQFWQTIVQAKIRNQKTVLEWNKGSEGKIRELEILIRRVKSGDPENIEAQAARHYWPALMGKDFRRDQNSSGINSFLNYGYAILRAAVARSVVSAGLTPALGLHHKNRVNSFALVDDLMEPFRPLIDHKVRQIANGEETLTPDLKRHLVSILQVDLLSEKGVSPLTNCLHRLAQSLVQCLTDRNARLAFPELPASNTLFSGSV